MPHQTNRSSRRSDACHLCSLQSWKVKKASTASQQSLHVNITYSSDEGVSEYTHHQATGDGLHSSSVQTLMKEWSRSWLAVHLILGSLSRQ